MSDNLPAGPYRRWAYSIGKGSSVISAAAASAPPTTQASESALTGSWAPWIVANEQSEHVPELTWPQSVSTYHMMRADSQVSGLMFGLLGPILRRRWRIDPNGAKPAVYQAIADTLGLDIKGEDPRPRGRARHRFSFGLHMYHALLAPQYGHMFFEQVGEYRPVNGTERWMLKKLVPIMPHTIGEINVEKDGGLKFIRQNVGYRPPELPISRLVAYPFQKEGASWTGRSLLRPMYRHWLRKDRLMRVDALKQERQGMGIPWFEAPPGATPAQINALALAAQKMKAGSESGGAGPYGAKLSLVGTTGTLPDTIASIRYDDEAMARSVSMMIVQLGQTDHGSRALGESFDDLLDLAQDVIADWFVDIFNEHVIEDWVDWGWSQDEQAPLLTYAGDDEEETDLPASELRELIDAGVIEVDDELEEWIRSRENLPVKGEPRKKPEPPPAPVPVLPPGMPAVETTDEEEEAARGPNRRYSRHTASPAAVRAASSMLPRRQLWREPYEHELRAQVDYRAIDEQFESLLDQLTKAWSQVRDAQIDELAASVRSATTLSQLSSLTATPIGSDIIYTHLRTMAEEGMAQAIEEAKRQGRVLDIPDALEPDLDLDLRDRAQAVDNLMARSLSEAGSRHAVQRFGGSLTPDQIANEMRQYLMDLSDQYVRDQFHGTLSAAMNTGRSQVFVEEEGTKFYASELLDVNTCDPCKEIDGTEYEFLDDAQKDYPTGGYHRCKGGPRCRGTYIAVYEDDV